MSTPAITPVLFVPPFVSVLSGGGKQCTGLPSNNRTSSSGRNKPSQITSQGPCPLIGPLSFTFATLPSRASTNSFGGNGGNGGNGTCAAAAPADCGGVTTVVLPPPPPALVGAAAAAVDDGACKDAFSELSALAPLPSRDCSSRDDDAALDFLVFFFLAEAFALVLHPPRCGTAEVEVSAAEAAIASSDGRKSFQPGC